MKAIDLSICMPTYNFGRFIGETLDSIIPQMNDKVEIVVLDGGSTDNTPEVVKTYMEKYPVNIQYYRQRVKGGIDRDMALSVEKAKGTYVWLFSSDDVMKPGSLAKVLSEISHGLDVYNCGFTHSSLDISEILYENFRYFNEEKESVFNLSNESERRNYFNKAILSGAFFSYMSTLIIKKARWIETSIDECYFSTCWAHAARIFAMIPKGLKVKYLPQTLLIKRGENDSFLDKGYIHRVGISIYGYSKIANGLFGENSFEAKHIRRILKNEFSIKQMIITKEHTKTKKDLQELNKIIDTLFCDSLLDKLKNLGAKSLSPRFARYLRNGYKAIKKIIKRAKAA